MIAPMTSNVHPAFFYTGYVLLWSLIITAGGALVGAVVFPIVGTLGSVEMSAGAMAWSGARQLGFLTFIWAVGIAIVMAFQHAHRRRQAQRELPGRSAPSPAKEG